MQLLPKRYTFKAKRGSFEALVARISKYHKHLKYKKQQHNYAIVFIHVSSYLVKQ